MKKRKRTERVKGVRIERLSSEIVVNISNPTSNALKPQLQRKKIQSSQVIEYRPKGRRTKWEVIKALQGEFDKFPDDTVFTAIDVVGIGIFGTRYI